MQRLATESELENDASSTGAVTPPKVVLFGDSISSVVGYGQDSQADNRFGSNVAGVVSSYLGTPVDSQAMGGITTKDALTGSAIPFAGQNLAVPYGTYERYLQEQRPDVVVLRFGAADAIRLNDPKETLLNLRKMLDLAKSYGATPVLIGVSPFAAGGDSRAGNINVGSIDPYIASAEKINEGIRRLAQQNDLPFVDMQRLAVPQGALLDGVHPTAEFGKSMADYIGKAVKSALPEFGGSNNKYLDFVLALLQRILLFLETILVLLILDQLLLVMQL
jgi:lysophospholipase L1-like esterase